MAFFQSLRLPKIRPRRLIFPLTWTVRVFAVGVGRQTDQALLQMIAQESEGQYLYMDVNPLRDRLLPNRLAELIERYPLACRTGPGELSRKCKILSGARLPKSSLDSTQRVPRFKLSS